MRAVCYARVSTDEQAEKGYSLPEQKALLAAYCRAQNLTMVEHVVDEGISGKVAERPGLRRIRSLVEAGAVDTVVAMKVDRLAVATGSPVSSWIGCLPAGFRSASWSTLLEIGRRIGCWSTSSAA